MELLLLQDVEGLGKQGDIVNVARGYARNYLLPKKMAQVPNNQAIEEVRAKAEKVRVQREAEKADQMEVAKKMATVVLRIPMKASETGHLYGSVGSRQIVEALAEEGYELDEKQIVLDTPFKELGDYDVTISLHAEVQVPVKVAVEPEEEEA
jgi:large subunit ribosomal protein L9